MRLSGVATDHGVGEVHGDVAVAPRELSDHGRHVGNFGLDGEGLVEAFGEKVRDGFDGELHCGTGEVGVDSEYSELVAILR